MHHSPLRSSDSQMLMSKLSYLLHRHRNTLVPFQTLLPILHRTHRRDNKSQGTVIQFNVSMRYMHQLAKYRTQKHFSAAPPLYHKVLDKSIPFFMIQLKYDTPHTSPARLQPPAQATSRTNLPRGELENPHFIYLP